MMNSSFSLGKEHSPVLKKIKRKSQMLADMHGQLADGYLWRQNTLYYGSLFTSCVILAFIFLPQEFVARTTPIDSDGMKWLQSFIAIVNFFTSLVLAIWRPSALEARHRDATRHYTKVLYTIRNLEDSGCITEEDVRKVQEHYLKDEEVPPIPGNRFLTLKRRYLVKKSISQFLDEHPHCWIWAVRARLWFRELRSGTLLEKHATKPTRVDIER